MVLYDVMPLSQRVLVSICCGQMEENALVISYKKL
uniref:Uncharacterized protein n=1 Tax=Rhizophora mucronata TaxID=61149 RepID=A0A2P2NFG5_RHIMU